MAEVRKLGVEDLLWGTGTYTSPAGASITRIPYPLAGLGTSADGSPFIDIRSYGEGLSTTNGTDDWTEAFQAAIDAGKPIVLENGGTYLISSTLNLAANTAIIGVGGFKTEDTDTRPTLSFAAGITGLQAPEDDASYQMLGIVLQGLVLSGGATQLSFPNGGVGVVIKNVKFSAPSSKGIHAKGFNQEWFLDTVDFAEGEYGIYFEYATGSFGSANILDKCDFRNIYAHGQSINGIYAHARLSNSVVWYLPRIVRAGQDGFNFGGGISNWTFIEANNEGNGWLSGVSATSPTTGSISSGSASLTVASVSGLAIGNTLTVQGAGANGWDLYATISNIAGTTVTLGTNASTTVTNGDVTKYTYSDLKCEFDNYNSYAINIIGGHYGIQGSGGGLRYGIDLAGCTSGLIMGTRADRPIYDPYSYMSLITSKAIIRQPTSFSANYFRTNVLGSLDNSRTLISSPKGNDIVLGLQDSEGDLSGTRGNVEIRVGDSNRTAYFKVTGTAPTGSETALYIRTATGLLQRVEVGASDSGGSGYRVLRVTN